MVNRDLQKRQEIGSTPLEVKAVEAFKGVLVGRASDVEIKQALAYTFALVGLTNYPDEAQRAVLLKFMKENFALFTLQEIRLAFEMLAKGEIEAEGHFQQYSAAYFSGVMNAYKKWAIEVRKQYDKPVIEQPKVTVSENHWRGIIQKTYETYSEKTNFRLWPIEFYDQLQTDGFIELRYHEGLLTKAREMLCAEANKKMMETGDEIKLKSLQDLITAYRGKYREFEVILLAKQLSIKKLFEFGKTIDAKGFYYFEPTL